MPSVEEYKIFLASKPQAEREFRTVEFNHVDFGGPLRFVKDFVDKSFALESGPVVLFTAISMDIIEPTEDSDSTGVLTISLGATNDELQDKLNLIKSNNRFKPVSCVYRKYYSGDLSEPVLILQLSVSELNLQGYTKNNLIAEDSDLAIKTSGEKYDLARFPTLRNI